MKKVRTRFAPSPTGMQHVGGFRTAMYAWLLARHFDGEFVLRIEDTDQERKIEGAVKYIIESLNWLGIDYDEGPSKDDLIKIAEDWDAAPDIGGSHGPYVQSLRIAKYQAVAQQLIDLGCAYRCDCTAEMLKKERDEQLARRETPGYSGYCRTRNVSADTKHVIRFKIPAKVSLQMEDAVRGIVTWENPPLRDPIILKSDGFPTYHLASIVDDHDMEISHVMRGEEWLPTTPLHLMLYDALGWERPVFCHLSHILGADGKKLSKRHGAVDLNEYKGQGYLPEAILNFIALIGWSPGDGDNQEVFKRDELVSKFSLKKLSAASGTFDINKLNWMNGIYIRSLVVDEFSKYALPIIEEAGMKLEQAKWDMIAPHVQERLKVLTEIPEMVEFLFKESIEIDLKALKGKDSNISKMVLSLARERLSSISDFTIESVEAELKGIAKEQDIKFGQVFMPVRIAVTGKKATPPLFESIVALGQADSLRRIDQAISML